MTQTFHRATEEGTQQNSLQPLTESKDYLLMTLSISFQVKKTSARFL